MCGRYTYLYTWKQLHRLMELLEWPSDELTPRFNLAPTQAAPVVRLNERHERAGVMLQWGLVPSWAKDPGAQARPFNARGDSIFSKPMFRAAAKSRRCLVPVSGFYEWQEIPGAKRKVPHWIGRPGREPFCFAGLWESWLDPAAPDAAAMETFTIVTTTPNALMAPLHDRMPVIVEPEAWDLWLDPEAPQPELERLIAPYPKDDLVAYPVGTAVNRAGFEHPSLIERAEPPPGEPNLFG